MKESVFQSSLNGRDYPVQLLKYVTRILHKFPTETPDLLENNNSTEQESMLLEIRQCLHFVQTTIQPSFKHGVNNYAQQRVDRDKLTQLWQTKQSRAIEIINNNCKLVPQRKCNIDPVKLEKHYNDTSKKVLEYPLPRLPWADSIAIPPPDINMDTTPFTKEDIITTIKSLKTRKAPG